MNKVLAIYILSVFFTSPLFSQSDFKTTDSVCGRKMIKDKEGKTLAWYKPEIPGVAYDHVITLASAFLKNHCPVDKTTGLPMYLVVSSFKGPHMTADKSFEAIDWPHNPACVFAGSVESFAVDYRPYSGDDSYLDLVKKMIDYELQNGTTADTGWVWKKVPYASSDAFAKIYDGAHTGEKEGFRGDGRHGIEPDKVGELGLGYLKFYEITLEKKYLEAALHCADALAKNVRNLGPGSKLEFLHEKSPWPFRVNAQTGQVISEYSSNVISPVMLLDELIRIKQSINLDTERITTYSDARKIAWDWLYSTRGPVTTFVWNGYFEDSGNDPARVNRNQVSPIELAKYLTRNPYMDKYYEKTVPSLISWVASAFKTDDLDAIKEQIWCYFPMGSHSARYGAACALWYEKTGNTFYKDQAYRFLNFATYVTYDNGVVAVGPTMPETWFSDGYSDYVRHFIEAMAAVPEWAPTDRDHVLRSTSVIQKIKYAATGIKLNTFDNASDLVIRMTSKPKIVQVNGVALHELNKSGGDGFLWVPLNKGGVLKMSYKSGNEVEVLK
jgi:hypothetical protein